MNIAAPSLHARYMALLADVESRFPVTEWRAGDLEVWPLVRTELYLALMKSEFGSRVPPRRSLLRRALSRYATPCINLWKSRRDLEHWMPQVRRADAVLLGDGVSLDLDDGSWRDRHGEALLAALERRGLSVLQMQAGDLSRLPWHRATYAASLVAQRANRRRRSIAIDLQLSQYEAFQHYLIEQRVLPVALCAADLGRGALRSRVGTVLGAAHEFERLLRRIRPSLAFVVTYYADLGPPFVLACRRQGILSVDLQHCAQEGAHRAYTWSRVPPQGYAVLPAVFWHWTAADAAHAERWTTMLARPWHRALYAGHSHLTPYLNDDDAAAQAADASIEAMSPGCAFEREILVALQPVSGFHRQWDALAALIRASPPDWRWWIRRHPSARSFQDEEYRSLIELVLPNVIVDDALTLPLPALLRHMSVVVSRYSGAAAEAENFGVPALFLSTEAYGPFAALMARGAARVVELEALTEAIGSLPARPVRRSSMPAPAIDGTLSRLMEMSASYPAMCRQWHQDTLASRRNVAESCISSA
ncbi:MAG TPA: hypothetical protein VHZ99_00705 [Steroidobacteraceae bacterium]|jgi:hypothetical protein|nr:hypothetical protein [Steroidobacteraceae bacterium]